jgi:hypothetical protein
MRNLHVILGGTNSLSASLAHTIPQGHNRSSDASLGSQQGGQGRGASHGLSRQLNKV